MYCRDCGCDMGALRICPSCSCDNRGKSRITAGLLQLILGSVGAGRFYLGYNTIAVLQIAANLVSFGIAGTIWSFIDGIMILNGSLTEDAKGNKI